MKSTKDLLLLLLVLAGAAGAGFWVLQMDAGSILPQQQTQADQATTAAGGASDLAYRPNREGVQSPEKKKEHIRNKFESIVNGFLTDLEEKTLAYREKRTVVRDMVKPSNMRQFEYVSENNTFARNLMAEMETDMDQIIERYEKTDQQIKTLFKMLEDDAAAAELNAEWSKTKSEQLEKYMVFFGYERQIFDEYRVILNCFMQSNGKYSVDLDKGSVRFDDPALNNVYMDASARVKALNDRETQ
ncbi:MAG: hypothetical protein CMH27_03695 [Micavibrio sp.]|nr:hypothetical protein [Micavibrio sp.]